jgi:hypothetical protein
MLATQEAVFDALSAAIVMPLAAVYQHVPENTQPPVVIIGELTAGQEGGKGDDFERHTLEIVTIFRGPGRKGLYEIMQLVKATLHQQQLASPSGSLLSRPHLTSASDELLEDGLSYYGRQTFELFAQPA